MIASVTRSLRTCRDESDDVERRRVGLLDSGTDVVRRDNGEETSGALMRKIEPYQKCTSKRRNDWSDGDRHALAAPTRQKAFARSLRSSKAISSEGGKGRSQGQLNSAHERSRHQQARHAVREGGEERKRPERHEIAVCMTRYAKSI